MRISLFIFALLLFSSASVLAKSADAEIKKQFKGEPSFKGLNYECYGPTQNPAPEGSITEFGPVTFSFHCSNDDPDETTLSWRFYYDGVPSSENATSFTINPTEAEYNTRTEFEFRACNSTGCGGGRNPIGIFFAKRPTLSVSPESGCLYGTAPQSNDLVFKKYINFVAPDPDGDDPSTIAIETEVISYPEETGIIFSNPSLLTEIAHVYGPGTTKLRFRANNWYSSGSHRWGLYTPDQDIEFSCNIERSFSVESVKLAQSVFLEGENVDLVEGKPVMARVTLQGDASWTTGLDIKIPVEAKLTTDSGSYRLGGCFTPRQMDASNKVELNLFSPKSQSPGLNISGSGTLNIAINASSGAMPKDAGCGDLDYNYPHPVPWLVHGGPQEVQHFSFNMVPSPQLSLSFWNVKPSCSHGSCEFNREDDIQPFVQASTDLLKSIYPIRPESVQIDSNVDQTVESAGFGYSAFGSLKGVCGGHIPGTECFHSWVSEVDLMRVKAAGLMADKGKAFVNRKYIGVVPKEGGGGSSYFGALHARYPEANQPYRKGVTNFSDRTHDVVLVQSDFQLSVPHELVHSFGTRYASNDPGNPLEIHQPGNARAYGFNPLELSNGLKDGVDSLMRATVGFTAWIDAETYKNIYDRMMGVPQIKEIEGEELFINGAVNQNGEFITAGVYSGLKAGQSDGDSTNILQIYAYDPSGTVVSQSLIPFEYGIIPESDLEEYPIDTSFAPISTGIPYSEDTFRLSLAPIGGLRASVKSIFPSVEILRTSIENIPESAYIGDPDKIRDRLMEVADRIEADLSRVDIASAVRHMKNELAPMAISGLKEDFEKSSILDVSRRELSFSIENVSSRLEAFSGNFPVFQNEFLKVIVPSGLSDGQQALLSVKAIRPLERSDFEYFLSATLDLSAQRVDDKKRGLEWKVQTPPLSSGEHQISFALYMQNARLAKALESSIDRDVYEILLLKKKLEEATDPSLKDEISEQISNLENRIQDSKQRLQDGRVAIGTQWGVALSVH